MKGRVKRTIKLALQGGGSHGAFTWGVLDRLLEDERLAIAGVSGTSAGAMNAVALAEGLARDGPAGARKSLEQFWSATSAAARYSPIQRSVVDVFMGNWSLDASPSYILMDHLSRLFSPYDLNPMNFNPLRDVVARCIDFERVNDTAAPKLFLAATNVRTGRPKIFRQPGIGLDAVMASACLPFLFKAVEIDGEAYWDGGYMGNPALFPLVDECAAGDVMVIQINPFYRPDVPRSARDIQNRLNEITFNASLLKELRALAFLWEIIHYEDLERERFRDVHVHAIHAGTRRLQQTQCRMGLPDLSPGPRPDRRATLAVGALRRSRRAQYAGSFLDLRRKPEAGASARGCGARNRNQGGRSMTPGKTSARCR